jgi:hypothetical protein
VIVRFVEGEISDSGQSSDRDGGKMTHKNCRLFTVQTQDDGWGFVVLNGHSKPLVYSVRLSGCRRGQGWAVMARMTSCPACGAMISAEASICPRCGANFNRIAVVHIGLAIMLAIAVLYALFDRYSAG